MVSLRQSSSMELGPGVWESYLQLAKGPGVTWLPAPPNKLRSPGSVTWNRVQDVVAERVMPAKQTEGREPEKEARVDQLEHREVGASASEQAGH